MCTDGQYCLMYIENKLKINYTTRVIIVP